MFRLVFATLLAVGLLCAATLSTLIGTGRPGFDAASVNNPYGMTFGPDGALYFCDIDNHAVRRYDLDRHTVSTALGTGLKQPYEVRFDRAGDMFVVDMPGQVIWRVDAKTHGAKVIAGSGTSGYSGDGGPAIAAQFHDPHSIAFDPQGRLLVCDIGNNRVRRIDLATGLIETVLGGPEQPLRGPRAMAFDREGNLYLVLREGNAVYRFDPSLKKATKVAGTGAKGLTGDGGPALEATFNGPKAIAFAPDGSFYLADTENHVIRRIDSRTGIVSTVAGNGKRGDSGDEADPKQCAMNRPHGVAVAADGTVYIADSESHRIRRLR